MLRLTSFSVESVFLCLSVLALLTFLPQPAASETELFYNCVCKIQLLGNVDASIPIPQLPKPKSELLFFVHRKSFRCRKNHPPEPNLTGDCIKRFEGHLMISTSTVWSGPPAPRRLSRGCSFLSAVFKCDNSTFTDEPPSFYFFPLSKMYCNPTKIYNRKILRPLSKRQDCAILST